ncbi:MAG: hypothetical protein LBD08_02885 [Treponema sp.]|jgi:hypothetical protein|nr:hypothetical protein [Treponema sp.]
MKKRINFEDNIFSLNARIRLIGDLLVLDTDPELYLGKILDDVGFIDRTLAALLQNLRENQQAFDREEQFQNLAETEEQFLAVLETLTTGGGSISAQQYPIISEKTGLVRNRVLERQKAIAELLPETSAAPLEPVVSSDELSELLKDLD